MLIPSKDAKHFLRVYQELLRRIAVAEGKKKVECLSFRLALYHGKYLDHPSTDDADLLASLKTAVYDNFVVGWHLARHTEMVGKGMQVYRVQGLTTEIGDLLPPWVLAQTAVMQFRGQWICDGLFVGGNILIGRNMIREYTEIIRDSKPPAKKARPKAKGKVKPDAKPTRGRLMPDNTKEDKEREERITMEIVVDAYDEDERAMGWYCYLENTLSFPFRARCIYGRSTSILKNGDKVEVTSMADSEECKHEMFVTIRWKRQELDVPLSQLEVLDGEDKEETRQAAEDWHYWTARGYGF